ncbi:MAG: DNA repair protein RecO [Candidatus Binatia bacterium]
MRKLCVTPAIVLRSRPFGESDKIVSFLTRDYGKVTGIAKGAKRSRKRFVNVLEPFCLVNLQFQERPHSSLTFIHACDWILVFKDLTMNLEKIAYASYLVEITDELTREREENRSLFEHLKQGLVTIEENQPSLSLLAIFQMKLLRLSGYQPRLDCCRRCGKKQPGLVDGLEAEDLQVPKSKSKDGWRFSLRDGGILCEACFDFRKETLALSLETLHALTRIQVEDSVTTPSLNLSLPALKETRSILSRFIEFQINKELKSVSFLDTFYIA